MLTAFRTPSRLQGIYLFRCVKLRFDMMLNLSVYADSHEKGHAEEVCLHYNGGIVAFQHGF